MIKSAQAIYQFLSSFGIPAYNENKVPDNAELPYITYSLINADWRDSTVMNVSIWYAGTSLTEVYKKADEIGAKIGEGLRLPVENGCVWLNKDNPFCQDQPTDKDNVTVVYLLIGVQAVC